MAEPAVIAAPVADLWATSLLVTAVGPGAANAQAHNRAGVARLIRPSRARPAITATMPVSWGRPGAQVGPSVAFLLPRTG
ncbi:hypothetical protein V5P93_004511 [Actinokineospora auranticolor]|uniref:hypothetical protein n=1 Tax=Actinokineospora auranticolor TaxID=155976 RepID=UPI000CEC5DE1|nr:hypothetical protein [Actinokineospora auranticolor]